MDTATEAAVVKVHRSEALTVSLQVGPTFVSELVKDNHGFCLQSVELDSGGYIKDVRRIGFDPDVLSEALDAIRRASPS